MATINFPVKRAASSFLPQSPQKKSKQTEAIENIADKALYNSPIRNNNNNNSPHSSPVKPIFSKTVPNTPFKKSNFRHTNGSDPATQGFIKNSLAISNVGNWNHQGEIFNATPVTNASGTNCQLYRAEGPSQLIPGTPNNAILLRVYKTFQSFNDVKSMLKQQRENYLELRLAGLPIIELLNFDTMMSDGYLAVPYIPYTFELNTPEKVNSIRNFLETCYIYDIIADAHNGTEGKGYTDSNFRSETAEGQPLLCDLMHIQEDESNDKDFYRFHLLLSQNILPTWAKGKNNDPIINELDPRILNTDWGNYTPNNLTPQTVENFFKAVSQLKKTHLKSIQSRKDIEIQVEQFQTAIDSVRSQLGLDQIPLATLKSLLRFKIALSGHFFDSRDELFTLKIRDSQGKVKSIGNCLQSNYESVDAMKADVVNLISNGNPAIKNFLTC